MCWIFHETLLIWLPIRCPLKKIVYASWKVLKICLRTSKRWLILSDSVRCFENFWSLGRCFDLFVDKHKCAFSFVEKCQDDQLALSLNLGIFRTDEKHARHIASLSCVYKHLLSKRWFYTVSGTFLQIISGNMLSWNIFLIKAASMLASTQIKIVKPPDEKPWVLFFVSL